MNKIYADVSDIEVGAEPDCQWVVLASEVEEREAALTDHLDAALRQVKANWDYAQDKQQRLTATEQFVQKLIDCTKNQDSIATGYLSDILDVIKGENV